MLSINDYNHLKLLYDNFFKSNSHIASLIEADDWDSVDIAIQEKENIIRQIIFFEKPQSVSANRVFRNIEPSLRVNLMDFLPKSR